MELSQVAPSIDPCAGCLYIFLDEGGNLDFSVSGTRFFTLTAITKCRPFELDAPLLSLKYDLLEEGLNLERFHAAEDKQPVRNRVFAQITRCLNSLRIDSLIVEKRKTQPDLQRQDKFYAAMVGYLLRYVYKQADGNRYRQVIVTTDTLPLRKKEKAFEKAIKTTLSGMLPEDATYRVLHHDSRSSPALQAADYCNWAIYRKWTDGDERSYSLIKEAVKSEFDIFRTGTVLYY
jgi:hypothetical protein